MERARTRELRAQGWTMPDIAVGVAELCFAVDPGRAGPAPTTRGPQQRHDRRRGAKTSGPNTLARRKQKEIEHFQGEGKEHIGELVRTGS